MIWLAKTTHILAYTQTLGSWCKMHEVTQLVLGTRNMQSFMHTVDCTCTLTCTITCAKLWPIPWHRVACDFMHIETKMHEKVTWLRMHYTHFRLNSLPGYSKYYIHKHWGSWCKMHEVTVSIGVWNMHSFMHTSDRGLYLYAHVQWRVQNKLKIGWYHDTGLLMISCT